MPIFRGSAAHWGHHKRVLTLNEQLLLLEWLLCSLLGCLHIKRTHLLTVLEFGLDPSRRLWLVKRLQWLLLLRVKDMWPSPISTHWYWITAVHVSWRLTWVASYYRERLLSIVTLNVESCSKLVQILLELQADFSKCLLILTGNVIWLNLSLRCVKLVRLLSILTNIVYPQIWLMLMMTGWSNGNWNSPLMTDLLLFNQIRILEPNRASLMLVDRGCDCAREFSFRVLLLRWWCWRTRDQVCIRYALI